MNKATKVAFLAHGVALAGDILHAVVIPVLGPTAPGFHSLPNASFFFPETGDHIDALTASLTTYFESRGIHSKVETNNIGDMHYVRAEIKRKKGEPYFAFIISYHPHTNQTTWGATVNGIKSSGGSGF